MAAARPISISALRECAEQGLCQREAAEALGISLSTLKNRFNDDAELRELWAVGAAVATKRAVEAMGKPKRNERRFFLNLRRDMVERMSARAAAKECTLHAFVVAAIELALATGVAHR